MPSFDINTATQNLKADAKGQAQAIFVVKNTAPEPKRVLAEPKGMGATKREWLSIADTSDRDVGSQETETFNVNFNAPNAAPGKYAFRLDVAAYRHEDEDRTEGPTVTVEVAGAPPPPPPGFPKWIWLVIAAIVLLVGGVGTWLWLRRPEPPQPRPLQATGYTLPDVADTSEEKAKQRLERECPGATRPCVQVELQRVFNEAPKDRTLRTEPAAGTEVEVGSKVVLFTSRGTLLAPKVANQPAADAEKLLREFCADGGCTVVTEQLNHDTIAPGLAVDTLPQEGKEITPGQPVTLLISSGPEMKTVGRYIGMQEADAVAQIGRDGFTVGDVRRGVVRDHRRDETGAPRVVPPGVYTQDPQPGQTRPKGSRINLGVNTGG